MPEIIKPKEAIEGNSVSGHCREPLKCSGPQKTKAGLRIIRYIAKFDVKSKIDIPLSPQTDKICPNAHTNPDAELVCDKATIDTIKDRISCRVKANLSATHGGTCWTSPCQTAVSIVFGHQALLDGLRKRILSKAITY